ncbi:hypothetical protein FGO68_gene4085 [Halteria grandinella]|uniref:Uncharacterized protein n=1 Tax=Halteria grandinella TaxID=5974 RepID=A0A8J8T6Q9_HALGN|nr:hypothetical protein FGO68_gene4085 [Halteria grandinella]
MSLKLDSFIDCNNHTYEGLLDQLTKVHQLETLEITNQSRVSIGYENNQIYKSIKTLKLIDSQILTRNESTVFILKSLTSLVNLIISFNKIDEIEQQIFPAITYLKNLQSMRLVQGEDSKSGIYANLLFSMMNQHKVNYVKHVYLDIQQLILKSEQDQYQTPNLKEILVNLKRQSGMKVIVSQRRGGHIELEIESTMNCWTIRTERIMIDFVRI